MNRRRIVSLLAVVLAIGLLGAWRLPRRVPSDHVALDAAATRRAGWIFASPWNPPAIVAADGRLELRELPLRTREGSTFRFSVDATYHIPGDVAPALRTDAARRGFEFAVSELAATVLARLGAERPAEELLTDPTIVEAAIGAALSASGVALDGLRVTTDVQDQVLLRRRTEEARGLARPLRHPLLIVGLDGADWKTIDPLIAAGRLPHLARLVREGARGRLRSYDPMFSPLLWTTVATGKAPDKHGVADFLVLDPGSGNRRPITSDYRKVKALWNIYGDFGIRSAWLSWWASFPAEAIDGVIVSNMLPSALTTRGVEEAAQVAGMASPADLLPGFADRLVPPSRVRYEDVRRLFALDRAEFSDAVERAPLEDPEADSDEPRDPVTFAVKLVGAMRTFHNLALGLLERRVPVVAVYYEGVDMMGHRFQHYLPPRMELASEEEFARFHDSVNAYYELQDEMLGELLAAAAPDTVTMVISDHGFRVGSDRPRDFPPYATRQPAEWHHPWGVLVLHGPGIRAVELPPATLYDIAPTLLYLAGLPLAEDMPGRLIDRAFAPGLLSREPPRRIASYEMVGAPHERAAPTRLDPEIMAAMMDELRALGYVGAAAEPATPGTPMADAETAGESTTQVFYHRNLATNLIKQGELAAAGRELEAANRIEPLPKTYAMLSEIRGRQGRFREAAQALEQGLETIPDMMEPPSVLWMVEMLIKAGDLQAAAATARKWEGATNDAVRAAVAGRLAEQAGRVDEAIASFERALEGDPLLVHIALRLQDLYVARGEAQRLRPFLERTLAATPKADAYQHLLGKLLRQSGDLQGALRHFSAAVELQPENGLYLGSLAAAAAALGREREAREAIDWALRWEPSDAESWLLIGSALDRLGEPDRAVAAFRRARELGAPGPAADVGIALTLARNDRPEDAREALREALGRFPDDPLVRDLATRLGVRP